MAELIVIARIAGRWLVSSDGVMLTFQRELPDAIRQAVCSASQRAERGVASEVVVDNITERYTVWHSDRDGLSLT